MGDATQVEVLLATYNGREFVREQIDSILNQDYPNVTVLARDDGSTDGTPEVLREYAERLPGRFRVLVTTGKNGGIVNNFLSLMKASTAEYVCFSDQDDVWLPDKISKTKMALHALEQQWGSQTPLLVFSDLRVVDEKLTILHPSFWQRMNIDPEAIRDFPKLLGNPVVTGCTIIANRRLIDLASRMPREAALHDSWMALIASSLGKAEFFPQPTVLYRQHGRNAIGVGPEIRRSLPERLRRSRDTSQQYVTQWLTCQKQGRAFLKLHGSELPPLALKQLQAFCECEQSRNPLVRIATFLAYRFYSKGKLAKLALLRHLWWHAAGNARVR